MYTAREIVGMAKGILIAILLIVVFYCIIRNGAERLPSREMTVVDCYPTENYWTVVVEDGNGNEWSYYADHYTENGVITVLFNESETEIVDVR